MIIIQLSIRILLDTPVKQAASEVCGGGEIFSLIPPQDVQSLLRRLGGEAEPGPGEAAFFPLGLIRQIQGLAVLNLAAAAIGAEQGKGCAGPVCEGAARAMAALAAAPQGGSSP